MTVTQNPTRGKRIRNPTRLALPPLISFAAEPGSDKHIRKRKVTRHHGRT